MFTPLSSSTLSVASRPQIWFPEQRLGSQKKDAQIQKPTARNLQPKASNAVRVSKSPAGDSFQSSRPVSGTAKPTQKLSEQSTPDSDFTTSAFAKLGSQVGTVFGIQL